MFLIVSCTKNKSDLKRGKARDIYTGALFQKCVAFAEKYKLKLYIISLAYGGILDWNTVIDTYDAVNTGKPFDGTWPKGKGYFVGSRKTHFKNVPDRIKPLIPEVETEHNFGYGCQLRRMNEFLAK